MKLVRIVCRGSILSLAQANIFRKKLADLDPGLHVEIVIKETEGDANQLEPLTALEGKDFFTKDIQEYLLDGHADFAVHSLKDVSGEDFFKNNTYAIIERENAHDVAIFREDISDCISSGSKLRLGTSSPRRVEMATDFLSKALPVVNGRKAIITPTMIRGNVDTRLRKLHALEFDGIILACAGLNRLLKVDSEQQEIQKLVRNKRIMLLPLLVCPPAPGQGAIVAETTPSNAEAIRILRSLNVEHLARAVSEERKLAHVYGSGCHQKFGAVHIQSSDGSFTYAAGRDRNGELFSVTEPKEFHIKSETLSSHEIVRLSAEHIRVVDPASSYEGNQMENAWVSKTEAWYELARQGTWVQGSFEGLGLEFMESALKSPLLQVANVK